MIDRFSIIIVHRNGKDLIDHCLQTLSADVTVHDEVFVLDQFDLWILTLHMLNRTLLLLVNYLTTTLICIVSLGIPTKVRYTGGVLGYKLAWIFLGKPRHWGLPDKCPVGYGQVTSK